MENHISAHNIQSDRNLLSSSYSKNLYTNSSSFHANTGIIISGLIFIPFILFFITLKMMGKGMYRFVKDKNSIID